MSIVKKLVEGHLGSTGAGGSPVQPDWNQNDPNAADYVKGRTHYDGVREIHVIPETEFVFENEIGDAQNYAFIIGNFLAERPLVTGDVYTVMWDGVRYDATAIKGMSSGEICYYLGNPSYGYMGDDDARYPFLIQFDSYRGDFINVSIYVAHNAGGGTHICGVSKQETETVPLDEKYIPDTIARKSDLEGLGGSAGSGGAVSWNDLTDKPFGEFFVTDCAFENVTLGEGESMGQGWYKYTVDSGTGWSGFDYSDYRLTVNGEASYAFPDFKDNRLSVNGFDITADGTGKYLLRVSRNVDSAVISLHYGMLTKITGLYIEGAEAVADAAGDTPTAAEFNALLNTLRYAGLLRT